MSAVKSLDASVVGIEISVSYCWFNSGFKRNRYLIICSLTFYTTDVVDCIHDCFWHIDTNTSSKNQSFRQRFEIIWLYNLKKVEEEATKKKELLDSKLITTRIESGAIKVEKISLQVLAAKIGKDFNLGEGEVESMVLIKENKGEVLATDDGPTIKACKIIEI